ncbi:MAG: 16S rRNA (cytosine(1402)-N(4))-methyltransferase RsmH, partial [Myxococcales bacterium]|nr:16S rRNA (cytosine(1402)-N(4))-methyltransferase RsmH [Myxococcales bacterium]
DGPLDMRMDPTEGDDARSAIAALDADELANVIYRYGEEHRSRAVARSIKQAERDGALETTADLRRAVIRALGPKRGRIDPSTKTFQALRIHVNDELGELESLLRDAPEVLREGGVLAIISFHSLEDRMVKHTFRDDTRYEPLWKRPLIASDAELEANPRARSAKLRAARVGERSAA